MSTKKIFVHDDEFNLSLGKLKLGDSIEIMRDIYGHEKDITPAETPNHRRCKYEDILVTLAEVIAAYGQCASVYEDSGLILYEYPFVSAQGNLVVMRFAVKNNVVEYISLHSVNEERENILADVKDF